MILTIDMGNSNIVIGGIDDSQTYFVERVTTNRGKTDLEYAVNIKSILEIHNVPGIFYRGRHSFLRSTAAQTTPFSPL